MRRRRVSGSRWPIAPICSLRFTLTGPTGVSICGRSTNNPGFTAVQFTVPDLMSSLRRARLRFERRGLLMPMSVINGQPVGHHEGHFALFSFDVTDVSPSRVDENQLEGRGQCALGCAQSQRYVPIGSRDTRAGQRSCTSTAKGVIPPNVNPLGIWRPVWLVLDAGVSIDHVTAAHGAGWLG